GVEGGDRQGLGGVPGVGVVEVLNPGARVVGQEVLGGDGRGLFPKRVEDSSHGFMGGPAPGSSGVCCCRRRRERLLRWRSARRSCAGTTGVCSPLQKRRSRPCRCGSATKRN